ncbi:MAG: endo-1,4-beta-xylanase [Bacteroidaceae bacterium]|nr:endo-1,4-beta-xylanase [Bacteroidaceae bacterium]
MKTFYLPLFAVCLFPISGKAQLSSNTDKFLGNITTSYQMDYGNEKFYTLWNQVTPENETKWSSIEGSARGQFNWGGADNAANYARQHKFPFKFHTLIWGGQYPGWLNNLSTTEQYKAIVEWFDAVKKHYPNLEIIDVVNEALSGHNPAPYKAALGGDGKTGYDWIIKAFELAHERWPDAILIYNDFNTFQWDTDRFIELVRIIRDAGAPIDAYGCQSHDLTDCDINTFKSSMTKMQNTLKMPMYSTEYDIGTDNDALQEQRYKEQIPYMWEADYCAGITLWGYIYGHTWTTNGNSGIIRDGKDRPAMTWLREYMGSDKAKNAKSPFPGMKKEASVYVKPQSLSVTKGEPMTITVNARLRTKTIDHIDLYVKGQLYQTLTEAPYVVEYTPAALGKYSLKAVVVATDGSKYERLSSFTAYNPRSTFKGEIELPGTLQAENFDVGGEGVTFHDSDTKNEGTSYRTNGGGVDIVTGNKGYAIGYTATGEWLEYTVNVKKAGIYAYDAYVSSGVSGSSVQLAVDNGDEVKNLTEVIVVPQTGNSNWDKYVAVHGRTLVSLDEGTQIIRLNITGGSCNVDKFEFRHVDLNESLKLTLKADPAPATVNENTTLIATSTADNIQSVSFYVENQLVKTVTEAPFETTYKPTAKGTYNVTAEATDTDGKLSKVFKYSLKVNNKRTPYKGIATIPGIIQAENFDKGGEGLTFHDSDSKDEGDAKYRTDNEGVDLVKGNGGTVVGYTVVGEWLEYTVNITESGKYEFEATVSSGTTGGRVRLGLVKNGKTTTIGQFSVPQTGNNSWDTYQVVKGKITRDLDIGEQILRLTITGANCNIDKIELICTLNTTDIDVVESTPRPLVDAIYNLAGQRVDANYKGIVIKNGKKVLNR